jgi:adenosylmethionine-8-amino-7-oxononanoate aminotransferase
MFAHMERTLAEHAHEVAAVIVEPLVQCAGGMRMYDPEYLRLLRAACDAYGVHLIADEVAVGFGRTGTLFACEQAGIRPDFLCLSKGLTGGWLPLSVVMTTEAVYATFYDDYVRKTAFLHSHSYTGNALACAVACATLGMFASEPWMARNRITAGHMASAVAGLADHPHVAEIRQTGMILAIEVVKDRSTRQGWPFEERRGLRAHRHAISRGALLRPLGSVLYFMPPYVITPEEVRFLGEVAAECVDVMSRDAA